MLCLKNKKFRYRFPSQTLSRQKQKGNNLAKTHQRESKETIVARFHKAFARSVLRSRSYNRDAWQPCSQDTHPGQRHPPLEALGKVQNAPLFLPLCQAYAGTLLSCHHAVIPRGRRRCRITAERGPRVQQGTSPRQLPCSWKGLAVPELQTVPARNLPALTLPLSEKSVTPPVKSKCHSKE